jgi:alpha-L-fucosidase
MLTNTTCPTLKLAATLIFLLSNPSRAASPGDAVETDQKADAGNRNKPERLEWLQDAGFGMFIHWSVDSQLGGDISHVVADADSKVLDWYFSELPKTFNPTRFDPDHWLTLAKLAGMRYAVFTTKHHNGFCWWDTATTDFNIMKTPYGKDVVKMYADAARRAGLGVGIYFSPEDFLFLHQNKLPVTRPAPPMAAAIQTKYNELVRTQTHELMTRYGTIDILFIDGSPKEPCHDEGWKCNPDLLVTRGALTTPEQQVPGRALPGAWESNLTMGIQWPYKPTGEVYKSSAKLLELLVETRAKGGALLLNVGPMPSGELPPEQEGRLRDMALWHAFNGEAIHFTRPWIVTNEERIWFTRSKETPPEDATLYAIMTGVGDWTRGQRRTVTIRSAKATERTRVTFLGQNEQTLEYQPKAVAATTWKQTDQGLEISAMRTLRFTTSGTYDNPMVLKLEHVQPALEPPAVDTGKATATGDGKVTLQGKLLDLGKAAEVEVGFEYQEYLGFTEVLYNEKWSRSTLAKRSTSGGFQAEVSGLTPGKSYRYRAIVVHPKITMRGEFKNVAIQR